MHKNVFIILIGGCSRSGKSTLATNLHSHFVRSGTKSIIVDLDSWIIDLEKRKTDSKVLKRYNVPLISNSIMRMLEGEIIHPPLYDPVSRKSKGNGSPIQIGSGILIIEGVIALSINEFLTIADLKIFVDVPDFTRIKRLIHFYKTIKNLEKKDYRDIIIKRENEEVLFIKATKEKADIIYRY